MSYKEKNTNTLPSCKRESQRCQMLLWCLASKVVDHGEPLLIVRLKCDYICVDGMHHIAQHGN